MQALCLAKIDGLTHQQIATEMNISPRRVRTLLAKALDHCVEVCRAAGGAS
jgi:DNA-directed RNA polymerase specialized sigma24 family protein